MKTMICLILDRSGSMRGRESDVVGGVNTFLDEQKKVKEPASIAFVRFDSEAIERFREMQPLDQCAPLVMEDFQPRATTPLLDAVGTTIAKLDDDWKKEQPDRCILMIVTDGQENSSREYTKAKIKDMIESRQASGKWAIIYLGANVDAFAEAGNMGISTQNTAGYQNTMRGTKALYATASSSVANMRATGQTLAHNLGRNIGEDEDGGKPQEPATKPWTSPQQQQQATTTAWVPPA